MVPNYRAIFLLAWMLEQYWQYSRLNMTQTMEVMKVPAVQSSHITIRFCLMSLFSDFYSQLNKHKENNVYQHPQLSWSLPDVTVLLVRLLRFIPSITREQQSSIITIKKFRLSQTSRQQYRQFDSATRPQRYSFLMELCYFIMRSDAVVSIRKVTSAKYPRVQQAHVLSCSKKPIIKAAVTNPSSKMTKGPSLKMVVSIDWNVQSNTKCKINPYLNQHHPTYNCS